MALIKPGTSAGELSGKSGGSVFARNMGGTYVRGWARPSGLTPAQVNARARLSLYSQAWQALTQGARDAWNLYAASTPVAGRFGQNINISGFDFYVKTGTLMMLPTPDLDPATVTAPNTPGLADIPTFNQLEGVVYQGDDIDADPPVLKLPMNTFSTDDNDFTYSWISPPVSAGVLYFKGPWRPALFFSADAQDYEAGQELELAPLGVYATGMSVFIKLRQIVARKVSAAGIYGPFVIQDAP